MTTRQTPSAGVSPTTFTDSATRKVLGIDGLLRELTPDSELAKHLVQALRPFSSLETWSEERDATCAVEAWAEHATLDKVREHLRALPTLERVMSRLEIGETLDEGELFKTKSFLFHAEKLHNLGAPDVDAERSALLGELRLAIHPELEPSPRFRLSSELDPELDRLRREEKKLRRSIADTRKSLEGAILADHGGRFDVHGRYRPEGVAPTDPRLKIGQGGAWLLNAPELARDEETLEVLQEDVDRAEWRVRKALTLNLARHLNALQDARSELAKLDFRLAKCRMRRSFGGSWPTWKADADAPWLELEGARELSIPAAVPIDVSLGDTTVVTGPNMGGKSSLLRLAGATVWAAHHALPVPAIRCEFRPCQGIVYVGSEEEGALSASAGLSSFGREVRRLVDAWDGPAPRLFLLDEVGRGTHPEDGAAIASRVIADLSSAGHHVLAATHFPALTQMSDVANLRIAGIRDPEGLRTRLEGVEELGEIRGILREFMDYAPVELEDGDEIPRDAWLIAEALGLFTQH